MKTRYLAPLVAVIVGLTALPAAALDWDNASFYGKGALSLPMGDWGDYASIGFGPGAGVHVPHSEQVAFRGELAYFFYSTDADFFDEEDTDVSVNALPIMALVQYDLRQSPMYIIAGVGFTIMSVDIEYATDDGTLVDGGDSSTELSFAFGAGFRPSERVAIEGRFNVVSDANSIEAGALFYF